VKGYEKRMAKREAAKAEVQESGKVDAAEQLAAGAYTRPRDSST
jgi:hypothetical protein